LARVYDIWLGVVQGYSNKSTLLCTAVIRLLHDVSTLIRATKNSLYEPLL